MISSAHFGEEGVVLGQSRSDDGCWHYSVLMNETERCVHFKEAELNSLGTIAEAEEFYDGTRIRVQGNGPSPT